MRLVSVTISGYKRFATATTLKVDGDITALVGPNEAGKTSVLQAAAHVNYNDPFATSELTRGLELKTDHAVVRLKFLLEPDDSAALSAVDGAADVRWYTVSKAVDGSTSFVLSPPARRDISGRNTIARDLQRAARHKALLPILDDEESDFQGPALIALANALGKTNDEILDEDIIESIEGWAVFLREQMPEKVPQYVRGLPDAIERQVTIEREDRPTTVIGQILRARRPQFLLFGENERTLENSYDLATLDDYPISLVNLTRLAELDLASLVSAVREDRRGEVQGMRESANQVLRAYFHAHWGQTGLTVEFNVSGTELELYVREADGEYWQLEDRSEGLRWFVALVAYLHSESVASLPVLLIDEAEQHLHYDGQADLVRAFERQEAVSDVIYTTHSAGCLPQDLGTGVRVVARRGDDGSEIRNSLWNVEDLRRGAGFSGLLMQMGASTFAFAATRRAVICEGPSEVALLPTLLRQALGVDALSFQLVPGLANVANNSVVHLDMAAARVAFLVDSDSGGAKIANKLSKAKVSAERILRIGSGDTARTLEDLVEPRVLCAAVNAELQRSGVKKQLPLSAVRNTPRYREVERWCLAQRPTVRPPNKLAVAQQLLALARQGETIVNKSSVRGLKKLHSKLTRVLEAPPAASGQPADS